MSFEFHDLMVQLLPRGDGEEGPDLMGGTCNNCNTTGACPDPTQCPDCKVTEGETCEDTCDVSKEEKVYGRAESRPERRLALLRQQLRQSLSPAG